MQEIPIEQIRLDGGTQPRAAINEAVIQEYAEDMQAGATFPLVDVFYDGQNYWLADGFHRLYAVKASGQPVIAAKVHQGTQRDAILFSCSANSKHGTRRTNSDKRRAVLVMLRDPVWSKWSDSDISQRCFVTQPYVLKIRASLITVISEKSTQPAQSSQESPSLETITSESPDPPVQPPQESNLRIYTNKYGKQATMNVRNIGKKPAAPSPPKGGNIYRGGELVRVDTDAEVEAAQARLFRVVDAIQTLAARAEEEDPADFLCDFPPYMDYRIEDILETAADWLQRLQKAWRKRNDERAA